MKRIILIIGLCLSINLYALDVIDYAETSTWYLTTDNLLIDGGSIDAPLDGIYAYDTIWTINVFDGYVIGYYTGIDAGRMDGDIDISSIGSVTGTTMDAIFAGEMVGSISNSGIIDGDWSGIYASTMFGDITNYGTGNITGDYDGINSTGMTGDIYNYGEISGGYDGGIRAGAMIGNIVNYGDIYVGIIGDELSVALYANSMEGDITNWSDGEIINEYGIAIDATYMIGKIENFGLILGDTDGITALGMTGNIENVGRIYGGDNGIDATDMVGNIRNFIYISGNDNGIIANGMIGYIYNDGGIITSAQVGIMANQMVGNIRNYSNSLIDGNYDGINADAMIGYINNFGDITGFYDSGIFARDMVGNIINNSSGIISSTIGIGIDASQMGGFIFNYGDIDGGANGILATGMIGNIINDGGTINGATDAGIYANSMGGDIINYANSLIDGNYDGINADAMTGYIFNYGTITGTANSGIFARDMVGNIINYIGGEITGTSWAGIDANYMSGNITNYGSIDGDSSGIDAANMTGNINNYGDIDGGTDGIFAWRMIGNISNDEGTITSGNYGIYADQMVGNITNYSDSYITAYVYGIDAEAMTGSITNYGTITGDIGNAITAYFMEGNILNYGSIDGGYNGINASDMIGNITNYSGGTITTTNWDGIYASYMEGSITNYGSIDGAYNGIDASGMIGSIDNSGSIDGDRSAIYAYEMEGSIINRAGATINSDNYTALYAASMVGNITNDGTISGNTAINSEYMVGSITNDGTIEGVNYGIDSDNMIGSITNNFDGLIESFIGISAFGMEGNIYNEGTIDGYYGIDSTNMTGDIINSGAIDGYFVGIQAWRAGASGGEMFGSIYNTGTIIVTGHNFATGIDGSKMIGSIYNSEDAKIEGSWIGIDASNMVGDIVNDGDIGSFRTAGIHGNYMKGNITNTSTSIIYSELGYGIDAQGMIGSIVNDGSINAGNNAIFAWLMQGDIVNNADGEITSVNSSAIYFDNFSGTLYNYGLIQSIDGYTAITSYSDLNLVGNGTIIGEINGTSTENALNITNDMDTELNLSKAPLINWTTINLLQGEIMISEISPYDTTVVTQGGDTYVHLDSDDGSVYYYLNEGTLNPWNSYTGSIYSEIYIGVLYAEAGSTIVIDFGDENQSDYIRTSGFPVEEITSNSLHGGLINSGAILKFNTNEIVENGWSDTYLIFNNIKVSENVILDIPLIFTINTYEEIVDSESYYYAEINRAAYTDYAHYYNQGLAKFLDRSLEGNEENIALQTLLQLVNSTNEFNALLEPYNMVGYASLANNNVNWINNRVNKLYNILNSDIGSETSASNDNIGSSYATANPRVNRDTNGNNIWVDVYMSDNTLDGEAGFEQESDGYEVAFGIDREMMPNTVMGLSFNYSDFESDITSGLPVNVESEGFGINYYAQYKKGQFTHKGIIGYTGYENEAKRAGAEADFDSNEFYMTYRVEHLIEKKSCSIIPLLGYQYAHITYDDIIEDGGITGVKGYDYDSLQSELGVKVLKQLENLRLNASAIWLHEFMDTDTDATAVSGIGSYSQEAIERDEDIFRLSVGVDYQINEKINLSLDYAKEFGDNTDSDSVNAKISFSF